MGLRTTWEKPYRAVATLATADAPLQERLASAFHSHLPGLTPQGFAEGGLQTDFESLYVNAKSGKVLRTEWWSVGECQRAAQTILHLFVEVNRALEQEDFEGWLKNRLLGGSGRPVSSLGPPRVVSTANERRNEAQEETPGAARLTGRALS